MEVNMRNNVLWDVTSPDLRHHISEDRFLHARVSLQQTMKKYTIVLKTQSLQSFSLGCMSNAYSWETRENVQYNRLNTNSKNYKLHKHLRFVITIPGPLIRFY